MSEKHELRMAGDADIDKMGELAEEILIFLQRNCPSAQFGVNVLSYATVLMMMNSKPAGGKTRIDLFEHHVAGMRMSLEKNIEIDLLVHNSKN